MYSWILNGTEYELDDGSLCWFQGHDGIGAAPVRRMTEQGPFQHGVTDKGFRLEPRMVRLALVIPGEDVVDWWQRRDQILRLFPPDKTGILRVTYDPGDGSGEVQRQVDCQFAGELGLASVDKRGYHHLATVTLRAADPVWYDPAAHAITFGNVGGGTAWDIPWEIPWTLGTSTLDTSYAIDYLGTWESFPTIRIVGPVANPVITNETTGEKLDFTGTTIGSGDWYEIDLRYGHKTVVDESGANQISKLTTDSDLATWSLHPGTNSIHAAGGSIDANTRIEISYQHRYLGI